MWIKEKLYRKKIKRDVSFIYRYIYLIACFMLLRVGLFLYFKKSVLNIEFVFNTIINIAIALLIKRIIFNISKSDLLSVIGTFAYIMNLSTIRFDNRMSFSSAFLVGVVMIIVLFMQYLIDELKQKGIKTRKYIYYSVVIGIFMGISITFGINHIIWLVVLLLLLFTTVDLDKTHISFPKFFVNILPQDIKELFYKIERLNINKIIIAVIIMYLVMFVTSSVFDLFTYKLLENCSLEINGNNVVNNYFDTLKNNFNEYSNVTLSFSKTYYLTFIIYILTLEVLSFFLRRRYDTKTTVVKSIFIMLYAMCVIHLQNVIYFEPLIMTLFIIVAIINTSSIYLNRDERVKMLVAQK